MKLSLENKIGGNSFAVSHTMKREITRSAKECGLVAGQVFLDTGAQLWHNLSSHSNCLTILSGDTGCGKTSLRNTIIHVVRRVGPPAEGLHANGSALSDMRCINKVMQAAEMWLKKRYVVG